MAIEKTLVISGVGNRAGIGVEFYLDDELVAEIFRNDIEKSRKIVLHKEIGIEKVEEYISIFKREIPWDFKIDL